MAATLASVVPVAAQQSSSSRSGGIGYATVAAALTAMQSKQGVAVSVQGGWTIIEDRANSTLWSFTPAGHPAHPAAVRRRLIAKDGAISIQMNILCQAKKGPCDNLVTEFNASNARIRQQLGQGRPR